MPGELNPDDLPQIVTLSYDEDDSLVIDPGDNMSESELLGILVLATCTTIVEQVLTSLGVKLPEE